MSDLILYTTEDGKTQIDLRLQDGTVWLTRPNINKNVIANRPGFYPVINSGREPLGYVDHFNTENDPIGIASRGSVGLITWTPGRFFRGNLNYSCTVKEPLRLDVRFLYHFLLHADAEIQALATHQGIPALNAGALKTLQIPIPPLHVQKEIVRILDTFTELTTELTNRKKQYNHYRDQLLSFEKGDVEWKTLGEIVATIKTGKLNANAMVENGKYPFFTCDANPFKIDTYAFDTEAIIVSGNGSQVGHINYYKGKFNAYQRTYIIADCAEEITLGFLLIYLKAYLRRPQAQSSERRQQDHRHHHPEAQQPDEDRGHAPGLRPAGGVHL